MNGFAEQLREVTGASTDQLKLIFCLLISYPLGSLYVRLPHSRPELKHLFSVAVSAFFLLPVFKLWFGSLQLLGSILGTYVLISILPGRNMPWIVFAFVMGHLTLNHIYRAVNEIATDVFEITSSQMVLTMKLTMFAWNVCDGRRPVEELDKWQLKNRIVTMPSLLEFLGFAFYFPGFLIGPSVEYANYAALVDGSLYGDQKTASEGYVPRGRKRAACARLFTGLGFLGFFVIFSPRFPFKIILTDGWLDKGPLNRLALIQVLCFVERTKYYAVWAISEGASILTGLGFTGFTPTGATRWDGAANINILLMEWPSNPKMAFDSWNMKTNMWLKECVYKRVARRGKKPGFKSNMTTFITSAFWHGFAGGYYLTFAVAGFLPPTGRLCRTYIRPLFLYPIPRPSGSQSVSDTADLRQAQTTPEPPRTVLKKAYDLVGSIASISLLNFAVVPFILAGLEDSLENSLEAWQRIYWYGIWVLVVVLLFFFLGGKSWLRRLAQRRERQAEKRREEETKEIKVMLNNEVHIPPPGSL